MARVRLPPPGREGGHKAKTAYAARKTPRLSTASALVLLPPDRGPKATARHSSEYHRRRLQTWEQLGNTYVRIPAKNSHHERRQSKTSQQVSVSDQVCKTSIPGSNPGGASILCNNLQAQSGAGAPDCGRVVPGTVPRTIRPCRGNPRQLCPSSWHPVKVDVRDHRVGVAGLQPRTEPPTWLRDLIVDAVRGRQSD